MQKINLLPSTYQDRKKIAIAWVVVSAAVALEIVALVLVLFQSQAPIAGLKQSVQTKQETLNRVTGLKTEAESITNDSAVYDKPMADAKSLRGFNLVRPALYNRTSKYIYDRAMVMGMESSTNELKVQLYVTDIKDLAKTFLYIHNSPDFDPTKIQLSAVPEFKIRMARSREGSDVPPPDYLIPGIGGAMPAGVGGPAGGSGGAFPGAGVEGLPGSQSGGIPGMPTPPMGGAGAGASGAVGSPYASGGGMPIPANAGAAAGAGASAGPGGRPFGSGGMPTPAMAGAGAGAGVGGSAGGGGGSGGGGGNAEGSIPGIDPTRLSADQYPLGAVVTITCALRNPIQLPAIGGEGTDESGGGGGGGGGMSGGMGMPGGGMSGGMGMPGMSSGGMPGSGMGGGMTGGGKRGAMMQ
jgi:hypothetical protein